MNLLLRHVKLRNTLPHWHRSVAYIHLLLFKLAHLGTSEASKGPVCLLAFLDFFKAIF